MTSMLFDKWRSPEDLTEEELNAPQLDVKKLLKKWWPAIATVLVAVVAIFAGYTHQKLSHKPAFEEISGQIWRYPLGWRWLNAIYTPMPVNSFLIKQESSWALVDAGPSDTYLQNAATDLTAAVKKTIPAGESLAAILVTHVHPDHVGAIPQLLEAYPGALVIVHAAERVYLTHNYSVFPPSMGLRMLGVIPKEQVQISDARILSLRNSEGQLLEAFGGSRNPLPPVIRQLSYYQLPGTSPGNTAYLHRASGALFAGDTVFTKATFERGAKPVLCLPLVQGVQGDPALAEDSAVKLTGLPFKALWPTHDISRTGYSQTEAFHFNKTIGEVDWEFMKFDVGALPQKRKRKPAAEPKADSEKPTKKSSIFQYAVKKAAR